MSANLFTFWVAVAIFLVALAARLLWETMRGPNKSVLFCAASTAVFGALAASCVLRAVPHAIAVLGGAP